MYFKLIFFLLHRPRAKSLPANPMFWNSMKDALFICELGNTLKSLPYTDKIFSYLNRTRAHDILNGMNWQDMTNKGLFNTED
jgi:hypothetical protein